MAEGIGDAFAEGWREFRGIDGLPGHGETLLGPDRPPYCGEAVGEGRPLLVVPGAGRDLDPGTAVEARRQQGDDREQPEQAWRGTGDRLVRPLPLGFDAEVVAHLAEGDFELPALDEPADDLQRLLRQVGAEQRLRVEATAGIAQQYPADRHDRHAAVAPDGGIRTDLHDAVALAVPAGHGHPLPAGGLVGQYLGQGRQALALGPRPSDGAGWARRSRPIKGRIEAQA